MDPGSILLLLLAAGLLLLLFSRTRRQQRETMAVQSRLEPGVEVMTSSGLFATVVEIDGQVVVLQTGPGQHSRWDRRAVARILPGGGDATEAGQEQTALDEQDPQQAPTADPPPGRD